jgi:hypothetical protein
MSGLGIHYQDILGNTGVIVAFIAVIPVVISVVKWVLHFRKHRIIIRKTVKWNTETKWYKRIFK